MKLSEQQIKKIISEEISSLQEQGFFGKMADRFKKGYQQGKDWWKDKQPQSPAAAQTTPAPSSQTPAATPTTAAPAASPAQPPPPPADAADEAPPTQQASDGTSDIVLPHASLLKVELQKSIPVALRTVLSGLDDPQRKNIMTQAMNYINSLPKQASQTIAEAEMQDPKAAQQDLKAKLQAKHAANPAMISNNLKKLETDLKSLVRKQITMDNVKDKLYYSLPKAQQNTKQGLQYIKSLQQQPQKHYEAFLQSADLVIKNVTQIVQKAVSQAPAQPQKTVPTPTVPKQTAPKEPMPTLSPPPPERGPTKMEERKKSLNEGRLSRMKLLAGIIKK